MAGKPTDGSDLKLGLATAPVIYAALDHPELVSLISRQFSSTSEQPEAHQVQHVLDMVRQSEGIPKAKQLAQYHSHRAVQAAERLPSSPARDALIELAQAVVHRSK